jgi:hypothetical protein
VLVEKSNENFAGFSRIFRGLGSVVLVNVVVIIGLVIVAAFITEKELIPTNITISN